MASTEKIAYLAGFFDGEGTVTLSHNSNMKYRRIQLSLVNTDKQILDWIIYEFGGRIANKGRTQPHYKMRYQWILGSLKALELLKLLSPFLKETEKVRRSQLIIQCWEKHKQLMNTPAYDIAKCQFELEFFKNSNHPAIQVYREKLTKHLQLLLGNS